MVATGVGGVGGYEHSRRPTVRTGQRRIRHRHDHHPARRAHVLAELDALPAPSAPAADPPTRPIHDPEEHPMRYRTLGASDLQVSVISLGS